MTIKNETKKTFFTDFENCCLDVRNEITKGYDKGKVYPEVKLECVRLIDTYLSKMRRTRAEENI